MGFSAELEKKSVVGKFLKSSIEYKVTKKKDMEIRL